jgi:nucleotide-binding universal stress UspA family protein
MGFHRIVVPVDAAGRSSDALATALRAADPIEGRLRLIHVRTWQPPPPPSREDGFFPAGGGELFTETPQQAADLIEDALRYVRDRGVSPMAWWLKRRGRWWRRPLWTPLRRGAPR